LFASHRRTSILALAEIRLNIEYTISPVLLFALGSHGPEILETMPGHRNVRMISRRPQDGIALPYHRDDRGRVSIDVNS